jgi:tripartite ATP-independent transporter DctM subunit
MASISIPELRKYDYSDKLSVATVAASGTFATMFPPSIPFIIYGILTETSIKDLFLAGIIPGVLTLFGYMITIYVWGVYDPSSFGGKMESYSWGDRFDSLRGVWPALLVVVLTLGSLYSGVVTPTEAGAMGAFGAFVVAILFANLRLGDINKSHVETVELTAIIFLILIGAAIFGRFMTITGVIRDTVGFVSELPLEPWMILVLIFAVYIALGSVMDQLAILIITLPITFPIVTELGYSPLWFGVALVKTIEIGLITPPFGMNAYVTISAIDVDANTAFRGAMRFLVVDLIVLLSLLVVPDMVSWLPNMLN